MIYNDKFKKGFGDEKIPDDINLIEEILKLKKKKNAIILGHYYQSPIIQDISDFLGDSLALAQAAQQTDASIILFAGVTFMAETAKILNPSKKVIIPDINAGCSLSDSCNAGDFKMFKEKYPYHKVVTYINSSLEVKILSDVICTSSNAIKIINSIPDDEEIIFAPDKNLGRFIEQKTGRKMLLWNGACHVHKQFSLEKIKQLKDDHKDALLISHPECQHDIISISDFVGSTSALLSFVAKSDYNKFIIATESGILHQMKKVINNKILIPAPSNLSNSQDNQCNYMKLITLDKIYLSLKYELPEIIIDEELRLKALRPIERMLKLS